MHHKKRKPKSARGGAKFNKPWKVNGVNRESSEGERFSSRKSRLAAKEDQAEHMAEELSDRSTKDK